MKTKELCCFRVSVEVSSGFYEQILINIEDMDMFTAKKTLEEYLATTEYKNYRIAKIELIDKIKYIER